MELLYSAGTAGMFLVLLAILRPWIVQAVETSSLPAPTSAVDSSEIVDWLTRYGYLPASDSVTGQLQTWEAVTSAIRKMQRFAGIEETGILDAATLELMRTPRCSLPDIHDTSGNSTRRRRSTRSAWKKKNISWRIRTYPKDRQLGHGTIRSLMHYALKVWSEPTPLEFPEVAGSGADIIVEFLKADHQDGYPFDGPGGMVAHAFFPSDQHRAGNVHFDSDEDWTFRSPDSHGTDLFAVAVHEFGHALGLSHLSAKKSIMRPYYHGPVGDPLEYQLHEEDKNEIWKLYGARKILATENPDVITANSPIMPNTHQESPTLRMKKGIPDRCSGHFDAITQIRGEIFFFKGKYFWRVTHGGHLASIRPAQILRFWHGFPRELNRVDAAYERSKDHRIVFFKGTHYWIFRDNSLEEGYPRPVTDFGLPDGGIDGAVSRHEDGKTYFFRGNQYWLYDDELGSMEPGYPKESIDLTLNLDDAIRDTDGSICIFRGKEYWKLAGDALNPEPGYPRPIAQDWMDCEGSDSSGMPNLSLTTSASPGAKVHKDFRWKEPHPKLETGKCECQNAASMKDMKMTFALKLHGLSLFSIVFSVAAR
ncbi:matrix metalloproteinase-17-like [Protopterus annectens]|uniref:matrix metalloproteinase-17-like n=1 Tax=Protopterus annectens TaxID=7888 RepID=UPI001CF99044|nr:matrix metalloproteinase-17-like [Protopterus annectens]